MGYQPKVGGVALGKPNTQREKIMVSSQRSSSRWGKRKLSDHEKRVRFFTFFAGTLVILLLMVMLLIIYWFNTPGRLGLH